MDINLGPDEQAIITVHEGETAQIAADAFGKQHGLDAEASKKIEELVSAQLESIKNK